MALIDKTLRSLLPDNFKFGTNFKALVGAIATSCETLREYLHSTIAESNPSTAMASLDDWREMLQVDENLGSDAIAGTYNSTGGQSYDYLRAQMRSEFSDISIIVDGVFSFTISGNVNTATDFLRVQALVRRLFPLYDVATYNVTILAGSTVARCGLGITGAAITGHMED